MGNRLIASCQWIVFAVLVLGAAAAGAQVAIPAPDLSSLEVAARRQIEAERAALVAAAEDGPGEELGEQLGRLGQRYQAHGLLEAAAACYSGARQMAPQEPRWPYLEGVLAAEREDHQSAISLLRFALESRPGHPAAMLRLAEALGETGDRDGAADLYRRSLEVETTAAAYYGLGRLAYEDGDTATAIRQLSRAAEFQPTADRIHYYLARAYRRQGDAEAARQHLERAGSVEPTFPDPFLEEVGRLRVGVAVILERALAAFSARRYEQAMDAYRQALELQPDNAEARDGLKRAEARSREIDQAADTALEMLAMAPEEPLAQLEVGRVLLSRGRVEEAIEHLERAIELEPTLDEAYLALAEAHRRQGGRVRAAAVLEQALEVAPESAATRFALARARQEQGRLEEARRLLRRLIDEDPTHIGARRQLGRLLVELGETDGAEAEFQAILVTPTAADADRAVAHYELARIHSRRGRRTDAVAHDREAARLDGRMWQAHYAVARAMAADGRWAEAAEGFSRAVEIEPSLVAARVGEADSLMRARRFDMAQERLRQGLEQLPRAAELVHLLARLLAVAPAAELRDGERALDLASQIVAGFPSLEHAETVVMALAALGRFEEAIPLQERLVSQARAEGTDELRQRLNANLERYRRGELGRYP